VLNFYRIIVLGKERKGKKRNDSDSDSEKWKGLNYGGLGQHDANITDGRINFNKTEPATLSLRFGNFFFDPVMEPKAYRLITAFVYCTNF